MSTYRPTTLSVDGFDLSALGYVTTDVPGIRDVVDLEDASLALPTLAGTSLTDAAAAVADRQFSIVGQLTAATPSALRSAYRSLAYKCGGGDRLLVLVDDTAKRITARLRRIAFTYQGVELDGRHARVELGWRARNPYWEDVSTTTVGLTATPAACALGNADCFPVITVTGPATTPIIRYKNSAAATVASLSLATIASLDTVAVDMRTRRITHSVSGVTPALRLAGRFFALNPYDGDFYSSTWPTLEVSSGTASAVYRKAWQG